MKKPEKKTNKEHTNLTKTFGGGKILTQKAIGYNQAIDDYEKFLPSKIELFKIIKKATEKHFKQINNDWDTEFTRVAVEAISKRLGRE